MGKKINTAIALSGIAIFSLHIYNKIQFTLSTAKGLLNNSDNQYYEWRFGKIRYIKKGTGSPLLLIHNLTPGSCSYEYKFLIDSLSKNHEVYAFDLLGYGLSDKPNITYTNYLFVQSTIDFIKKVIGRKCSVIASGDSASIAVMAAHNDGEVIDKICLINPQNLNQLSQIPRKRSRLLKFIIETPVIGTFLYHLQTSEKKFVSKLKSSYFNSSLIRPELSEAFCEDSHHSDHNAKFSFASYMGRFMNTNIVHALKEIDHSIYLLYGKENTDYAKVAESYLSFNPSIECFSVSDSSVLPQLENPGEVLDQLNIIL